MTKRLRPEDEAVKRSPVPELSTTRAAREVAPEMEATGMVPSIERRSVVASGVMVPTPKRPVLIQESLLGVPVNLTKAEAVEMAPIKRSSEMKVGVRAWPLRCQYPWTPGAV